MSTVYVNLLGIGSLTDVANALRDVASAIRSTKVEKEADTKLKMAKCIFEMQEDIAEREKEGNRSISLNEDKRKLQCYKDIFKNM